MPALVLYGRHACHLCEVMVNELYVYLESGNLELSIVDVDEKQAWREAYGHSVPVLATPDGQVLCEYHLDEPRLKAWLEQNG